MLPAVRPKTMLLTAVVVTSVLTVLSLWVRLKTLDPAVSDLFGQDPPTAFAVAHRLFDADGEKNVPTWFSAAMLLMVALLSLGVRTVLRDRGAPLRGYWAGLAAVFAYLSLDELSSVHEELIPRLSSLSENRGVLTFPWVAVAAPLVVLFVLVYSRFLWRLPRRTAGLLLIAGGLYVGGGLGLEVVAGLVYPWEEGLTVAYILATSGEELLEMLGAALCVYAVARYANEVTDQPDVVADQPDVVADQPDVVADQPDEVAHLPAPERLSGSTVV